jgi:hypothetical protein
LLLATTLYDVRLELVKEELRLAAQGEIMVHEMSSTSFIMAGLELEECQYVLYTNINIIYKWLIII